MSHKSPESLLVIEAGSEQKQYLKDLRDFRELFFFFAWRDILVRYKQAFFGVAWALIRPLLTMAMFTLIFGYIANLPSDNVNYALFVLAGMLPWQLFSSALVDTSNSLLNQVHLISKVYFPRMVIPAAQIMVHLLDFAVGFALLLILVVAMGSLSLSHLIFVPLFIALAIALCLGSGLWLSALTVKYRDFRFIVPFVAQFGMFISPVGYGSFVIPEKWSWFYFLNPMAGIIDGFRWALFGLWYERMGWSISFSVSITAILLYTGFRYFRKMEHTFADKI